MSNYSDAHNSPRTVTLAGRQYLVTRLRASDFGTLQAWLKTQIPDPRKVAREFMEGLPPETQNHMWSQAVEEAKNWPPKFGSPEATELLVTQAGTAMLVFVALRRTIEGFTPEKAEEIASGLSDGDLSALVEACMPQEETSIDPKSEASSTETTTTSAPL